MSRALFNASCVIALWLITLPAFAVEYTVFTYIGGIYGKYEYTALKMALEVTREEYGDYVLESTPFMTVARSFRYLDENRYQNGVRFTVVGQNDGKYRHVLETEFPVYMGAFGYRICFANKDKAQAFAAASSVEDIQQFVHGQGYGWKDVDILENNGYTVRVGNKMENLYKMLSVGRVDIFCRGIHEIEAEQPFYQEYDNVVLDTTKVFYYDFPFFIYTNKLNQKAAERIKKGFQLLYQNGSLLKLWQEDFGGNAQKFQVHGRQVIKLENPELENVETDFRTYIIKPQQMSD
ncbi:hypothetical protein TDB9533_03811 [Thalassocella blandensis]|nr:hypothetical protein TDB9533_03811 [Thalassocella blandensis]